MTRRSRSGEGGYTLADMLAAILILSLAMVGLGQGLFSLGRLQASGQRALTAAAEARQAQALLSRFAGQIRTEQPLRGERRRIAGLCQGGATCELAIEERPTGARLVSTGAARLETRVEASARFRFRSQRGVHPSWPIDGEDLVAIELVEGDQVRASQRIWSSQPLDCALDPVSGRCTPS